MASFVQEVEGVRETGIGNQQIAQGDLSWTRTLEGAINTGVAAVDSKMDRAAKAEAEDLVKKSAQEIDLVKKEEEELAKIEALGPNIGAEDKIRQLKLLEKQTSRGNMNRDNARLLASNIVIKGIEESPFLGDRIRRAAANLLGFDPQSEAVRQVFTAFDSKPDDGLSAQQKEDIETARSLGVPLRVVQETRHGARLSQFKIEKAKNDLELGNIEADVYISEYVSEGVQATITNIYGQARRQLIENGSIDGVAFDALFADNKNAFIAAGIADLKKAGKYTVQSDERLRDKADKVFDSVRESIGDWDANKVTAKNLEQIQNVMKLDGIKAFDRMARLRAGVGDHIASEVFSLVIASGGNKSRLKALKDANPSLKKFIEFTEMSDEEFSKTYLNTMDKFFSTGDARTLSPQEIAIVDATIPDIASKAPPTERESIIQKLVDMGAPSKATSILTKEGRAGATPKEVKIMQNDWAVVKDQIPLQIADLLAQIPDSTIGVNEQGLYEITGKRRIQNRDVNRQPNPDVKALLAKINDKILAGSRGWAKDLGMKDLRIEAKNLADIINKTTAEVIEDNKNKKTSSLGLAERRQQLNEDRTSGSKVSIFGDTPLESTSMTDAELKRLEELRAKKSGGK